MSAGTLAPRQLQENQQQKSSTRRAGHTVISAGTMERLVAVIAADAFKVPLREVRAKVSDRQGQVSVSLALAVGIPALADIGRTTPIPASGTVFHRAAAARTTIAGRIHALAGTTVGRVDIRFTGAKAEGQERVQ